MASRTRSFGGPFILSIIEIRFSAFLNTFSNAPYMKASSWDDFVSLLADWSTDPRPATDHEKKFNTPLVSPAVYEDGAIRRNDNVVAWGGWFALDVDESGVTVDEAKAICEAIPTDYVIYTTTKSKVGAERYRVFFPLDREVQPDEMRQVWAGAYEFFGRISDIQTKDRSRIFNVPALWEGSDARFEFRSEGDAISVAELLNRAPPEPVATPIVIAPTKLATIKRALDGKGKKIGVGDCLFNSKVVHSSFTEEYLNLPKGAHHGGLYTFMAKVASRALYLGFEITPEDLVSYAKQLDGLSYVKTNKQRWTRISGEARSALDWARHNYSTKEFITNAKP